MSQAHAGREPSAVIQRSEERTLYDVLQVSPRADEAVLQAAYRALARAYHPDLNRSPAAAKLMRELNEAYAVLGDARQRTLYDLSLHQQRGGAQAAAQSGRRPRRRSYCWRCRTPLDGTFAPYCGECHWLLCDHCSACGCEHPKSRIRLLSRRLRLRALAGWVVAALVVLTWVLVWELGGCPAPPTSRAELFGPAIGQTLAEPLGAGLDVRRSRLGTWSAPAATGRP